MGRVNISVCLTLGLLVALLSLRVRAKVVIANGCGSDVVQAAIDAARDGDTVVLPGPCSATWNTTVNVPGTKGILLDGSGVTIERGSVGDDDGILSVSLNTTTATRVTGFAFVFKAGQDVPNGLFIAVQAAGFDGYPTYRLDHLTFTAEGALGTAIAVQASQGLIDHCAFTWTAINGGEMIHNLGYLAENTQGWTSIDITPGGADAVYIEDNVFNNRISDNPAYYWGGSAAQSYYGARTVFRHNLCNNCQIDQHGTAGAVGARWWEIYENTFNTTDLNGAQSDYIVLRGGSGVVFNNHVAGFANNGAGAIHMYEEDPGYPALYQVGRGKNQLSAPAYLWGNDSAMAISSDDPRQIALDRDYYLTPRPGYAPYTYPHPLTASSAPPVPSSPRIVR
jgi:hypothetical protein